MFKKLLLLLTLSVGFVFGQSGTLTDSVYWASKPPQVAALQSLVTPAGFPDIAARDAQGQVLAAQGFIIDRQIDIWGWDPVLVMGARAGYGYTWCPNAYQANDPNILDYLNPALMWSGAIPVSTDARNYPAFTPPAPPTPVSASPVGTLNAGMYSVNLAVAQVNGVLLFKDGQTYMDNTGTYTFHDQPGMFGPMLWWTKN